MLSLSSSSLCQLVFSYRGFIVLSEYFPTTDHSDEQCKKKKKKRNTITMLFSRSVYMCISYLEKCTGYEIEFSRSKCQESIRSDEWIYKTGD